MITLCFCPDCETRSVMDSDSMLGVPCMECGGRMIFKVVDKPHTDDVFELPEWFSEDGWQAPTFEELLAKAKEEKKEEVK